MKLPPRKLPAQHRTHKRERPEVLADRRAEAAGIRALRRIARESTRHMRLDPDAPL
jgi:hypothetical protein